MRLALADTLVGVREIDVLHAGTVASSAVVGTLEHAAAIQVGITRVALALSSVLADTVTTALLGALTLSAGGSSPAIITLANTDWVHITLSNALAVTSAASSAGHFSVTVESTPSSLAHTLAVGKLSMTRAGCVNLAGSTRPGGLAQALTSRTHTVGRAVASAVSLEAARTAVTLVTLALDSQGRCTRAGTSKDTTTMERAFTTAVHASEAVNALADTLDSALGAYLFRANPVTVAVVLASKSGVVHSTSASSGSSGSVGNGAVGVGSRVLAERCGSPVLTAITTETSLALADVLACGVLDTANTASVAVVWAGVLRAI